MTGGNRVALGHRLKAGEEHPNEGEYHNEGADYQHHISEDGEPLFGGLQRTVFHQNSSLHVVVDPLLRPFYLSCCWLKT